MKLMDKEIIHIEIDDWNTEFQSEACKKLFTQMMADDLSDICFNYSQCTADQAMCFFITATKEDLIEHGYDELLEFIVDERTSSVTPNFYLKYNPENWHNKDKNGLYFSEYAYSRRLYLLVDKIGREIMVDWDHMPFKITEQYYTTIAKQDADATRKFINEDIWYNRSYGCGWCQSWEHIKVRGVSVIKPNFDKFVLLPAGFIENYLGRKMTYEDDLVEYKTFDIKDVKPFGDL